MSIPDRTMQRLGLFDCGSEKSDCPVRTGKNFHLSENSAEGKADLYIELDTDTIHFSHLDKDKGQARFLKNKRTADHLLISFDGSEWRIHIVEIKKSVTEKNWTHIKGQFSGALVRAYEFCGLLDVKFKNQSIFAYSAYLSDKMSHPAYPVNMRKIILEKGFGKGSDWDNDTITLMLDKERQVRHSKIKMEWDEDKGSMIGEMKIG